MSLGFTGTKHGMTHAQHSKIAAMLTEFRPDRVHHGDCVGADAEFHDLVRELLPETVIEIHPPLDSKLRAWKEGDIVHEPAPYLERDSHIVRDCEWLWASPSGFEEVIRSGTWFTARRARATGRPVVIVWPDGLTEERG